MKIIVCLDDRDGMSFFGRRQSQDRVLREQLLLLTAGEALWMNGYSARQFTEQTNRIVVDTDYLRNAPENAWCFVETDDIGPFLDRLSRVVIYRWNRHYPSDRVFPIGELENKWVLESSREFPGSSHDVITEEVYSL